MKTIFKTSEDFIKDGFRRDYPYYCKGTSKDIIGRVRCHLVDQLGGHLVEAVSVDCYSSGRLEVLHKGQVYKVETWMLRDTIDFSKIKKPHEMIINGEAAKFYGIAFHFSCDHQDLNKKDAVKLARWVLKMAKEK